MGMVVLQTKRNNVTLDHIQTAIARGIGMWKSFAGALQFQEVYEAFRTAYSNTVVPGITYDPRLAFHIAKLDSLSSYYIANAEEQRQFGSCIMLLNYYHQLLQQLKDFPNATTDLYEDLNLDFKLKHVQHIAKQVEAKRLGL